MTWISKISRSIVLNFFCASWKTSHSVERYTSAWEGHAGCPARSPPRSMLKPSKSPRFCQDPDTYILKLFIFFFYRKLWDPESRDMLSYPLKSDSGFPLLRIPGWGIWARASDTHNLLGEWSQNKVNKRSIIEQEKEICKDVVSAGV